MDESGNAASVGFLERIGHPSLGGQAVMERAPRVL